MPSALTPPPYPPLRETKLFSPLRLGRLNLSHRIVLAPLTRMRSIRSDDGIFLPGDLTLEYYTQRASKGGLQFTEATDISPHASGYPGVPGIFAQKQIAAWKKITDAVHAKGGFIFCQLWHTGRASPASFRGGERALGASEIPIRGKALDGTEYEENPPRVATEEEIKSVVEAFASAARNAVEAGFDGVWFFSFFLLCFKFHGALITFG